MVFLLSTLQLLVKTHTFQEQGSCIAHRWGISSISAINSSADIKTCQAAGKKILLSLGGAAGSYGFTSDSQAVTFADTLWNLFGGGSSSTRPFDDAIIDGFDLDIEGGASTGYTAFVNRMRTHYAGDSRKSYYIAAAPQCPLPDAYLNTVLTTAHVDFIFVQFYNNYCISNSWSC
jgi:chitinase